MEDRVGDARTLVNCAADETYVDIDRSTAQIFGYFVLVSLGPSCLLTNLLNLIWI